jgi:hypothetical protein
MRKSASVLLAIALTVGPVALFSQDQKSPDLQQQQHPENNPQPDAHQPATPTGRSSDDKSPDTQQDQTGTASSGKAKKRHKGKNNARHAHGTPEPSKSE